MIQKIIISICACILSFPTAYARETKVDMEVIGLPEQFHISTSSTENEETKLIISNTKINTTTQISLNSVVFKIKQIVFLNMGKQKRPFLIVEWLKAPHGGWAFIYDLENLQKGHLDVLKSYYPFEEFEADKENDFIYLYGTSYKGMARKDPVIKFTWKPKLN